MADCSHVGLRVKNRLVQCPRAHGRYHSCTDDAADVASDGIVCKGRHFTSHVAEFTVHCKTCLDKCLESVTDTKDKTIAVLKEVHDLVFNLLVAENVYDELCRSVRFVTGRESSGEGKNLCVLEFCFKIAESFFKLPRELVSDWNKFCSGSCKVECTLHIKFTVCTREYRENYERLCLSRFYDVESFASFNKGIMFLECPFRKSRLFSLV